MCIFCKIVNKEIPCYKIYEDDLVLAFLDISQTTLGHTLVIPKKHYVNMLEIDDKTLTQMIIVTKKLALKITKALNATGFNLLANTNESAGQEVMHAHFHILPRYNQNDSLTIKFEKSLVEQSLNEIHSKIINL